MPNPFVWPPVNDAGAESASEVWDGRVVGEGLAPESDEFTEDTIASGKWGIWNFPGYVNASVNTAERCMVLSGLGNATTRWGGVYQPVPSNTFTFAAEICFDSVMGVGTTNPIAGLAVWTNALSNVGIGASWAGYDWERDSNTGGGLWPQRLRAVPDSTSFGAFDIRDFYDQPTSLWLRGRVSINAGVNVILEGDWSTCGDGVNWNQFRAQTGAASRTLVTAPQTAQHFGLSFYQLPASTSTVKIRHFRVWDGTATFANVPRNGGYL